MRAIKQMEKKTNAKICQIKRIFFSGHLLQIILGMDAKTKPRRQIIPAVFSFAVYFVENQLLTNFASALDIAVIMALAVMKGNDGANEFGPAN